MYMKNFKYLSIISICILIVFSSCIDDFLDREPRNIISDENVWSSESAIEAYMAYMYDAVQVEPHSWLLSYDTQGSYTDETMRGYSWGAPYTPTFADNFMENGTWNSSYANIRRINEFIELMPNSDVVSDRLKERYIAESYFLRAFHYFNLAKRFGGVPIIEEVQEYTGDNIEELKVPRNTEDETWSFVAEDLDRAISGLPESYGSAEKFRATKYAALALKSRAMLYAGSVSKYGDVQLNGLVGISSDKAKTYFEKSLTASQEIINSGNYSLYEAHDDKAENYQSLFLDQGLHEEAIYVKAASSPDKAHSFDYFMAAPSYKIDWGTNAGPTLELVEEYDYIDGSPGVLKTKDENGNPIYYDNADDIFKNKDPRFFASVLYPNAPWQNSRVEIRRGIIGSDGKKQEASSFGELFPEDESLTISGKDGLVIQGDCSRTGFYLKKYMHPVDRLEQNTVETNSLIFRYGEILLNFAEASVELGKNQEALEKLNEVRKRAGIKTKTSVSIDDVRRERRVELAFENHRYWDLVRWRQAHIVMNNTRFSALIPWLDYKTGKYIFEKDVNTTNLAKTFLNKNYYQPIPGIDQNEMLEQNPGF